MRPPKQMHQKLINQCKHNNAKAQMQLYNLYSKSMFLIAKRYVNDAFLAEDVMQDAFKDIRETEFDFDKYFKDGENYFFQWKNNIKNVKIKSKKEWEEFKNTKEYKDYKKKIEESREKIKQHIAKNNKAREKAIKRIRKRLPQ